jgi:L-amino acid N-acyltransferase YncA/ADP-ribose pyrophosphatase YjhB (NUDIX family)
VAWVRIRTAEPRDAEALAAIYNAEVVSGTSTWATEPETVAERAAWLAAHPPDRYPVLVAELEGRVAGWASLSPYDPRGGWAGTVVCSLYVDGSCRRRGVGSALLEALLLRGEALGYRVALAVVSADNRASLALLARAGFWTVGRLEGVGQKLGRTLDAVLLQRHLPRRAGAVVRDPRGRVLFVRREAEGRVWWVLPGGTVEPGERPEEAAARELAEETGLAVAVGPLGYRVFRRGRLQLYFQATLLDPATAAGAERRTAASAERGRSTPEWLPPEAVARLPCRPACVARDLAAGRPWPAAVQVVYEEDDAGAGTGRR